MRKNTKALGYVILAALITQSGCAFVAHKDVDVHGRKVSNRDLAQLKTGETTRAQLIELLGAPTNTLKEEDGVEVLNYTYRETTEKNSVLVFIWVTHSKTTTSGTVRFRLQDDVLIEYWSEGSVKSRN